MLDKVDGTINLIEKGDLSRRYYPSTLWSDNFTDCSSRIKDEMWLRGFMER